MYSQKQVRTSFVDELGELQGAVVLDSSCIIDYRPNKVDLSEEVDYFVPWTVFEECKVGMSDFEKEIIQKGDLIMPNYSSGEVEKELELLKKLSRYSPKVLAVSAFEKVYGQAKELMDCVEPYQAENRYRLSRFISAERRAETEWIRRYNLLRVEFWNHLNPNIKAAEYVLSEIGVPVKMDVNINARFFQRNLRLLKKSNGEKDDVMQDIHEEAKISPADLEVILVAINLPHDHCTVASHDSQLKQIVMLRNAVQPDATI